MENRIDKVQMSLQQTYNNYKSQLTQIAAKIGDLETESDEHTLVLQTISKLNPDRTAYRLIGGVLVQRTVGDVIPALKTNQEGIQQVMTQLLGQYKSIETEFTKFQQDNKIKVVK